jgi:hypothetical protein
MAQRSDWIVMGQGTRVRPDWKEYIQLEDHQIPRSLEIETETPGEPVVYARVEVTDSGARLMELTFRVDDDPYVRGIRQTDLRGVQVAALIDGLVAEWTFPLTRNGEGVAVRTPGSPGSEAHRDAPRLVERMRGGKTSRNITPDLLERAADIYRDNIARNPTKAVQHHFQVSQRMAAEYVSRARKQGLLPPTKQGKKQA